VPTTDWYGRLRQISSMHNDFLIARDLQRNNQRPNGFTGIQGVGQQDQAVTNRMGAIYDRCKEHLGSSDAMIIGVRRRLSHVVRAFADVVTAPPGVDIPQACRVRSGSCLLPKNVGWLDATRDLGRAFVEHVDLDRSVLAGGLSG